jgi:Protein of unknown function (DUF3124)
MKRHYRPATFLFIHATIVMSIMFISSAYGQSEIKLSAGETVYVSAYSNIYSGPKATPFQLAVMLVIRNTDPKYPISALEANYYDSDGNVINNFITQPVELGPLASTYYYIKEYDTSGGPGANFIVKWRSRHPVNMPIIEGIMLGLGSGQGISIVCPGQILNAQAD